MLLQAAYNICNGLRRLLYAQARTLELRNWIGGRDRIGIDVYRITAILNRILSFMSDKVRGMPACKLPYSPSRTVSK